MLILENGTIVGNTAPNIYTDKKPWKTDNGAYRWIVDNAAGSPFTDSDGVVYKLRKRTPAELVSADSYDAVKVEQSRLQAAFDGLATTGILTLDNKGAGEVTHKLGSKWYAVSVTPLDAAMPDIYVKCQKDAFEVKGGSANSRVMYAITLVAPEKGRENQILTDPC